MKAFTYLAMAIVLLLSSCQANEKPNKLYEEGISLELAQLRKGINNFNVAVKEYGDEVIFLRQIVPGSTDRSYGIHVAKLAGLPDVVIKRAKAVLETLEKANAANPVSVGSNIKPAAVRNKSRKGKDEDESELFQMKLF